MAGTLVQRRGMRMQPDSIWRDLVIQLNAAVDDLEVVRAGVRYPMRYKVENLSADGDIAARAVYKCPVAMTVLDSVKVVYTAASANVDGDNTTVLTLRNITEGVDIATKTLTATTAANGVESLTLTAGNADLAANDVIGIVVTNGTTADTPEMEFQWEMRPQTIDAAGDLTAAKIGDDAGTAYSA